MCLTRKCIVGSNERHMVALLSHNIVVGFDGCKSFSSISRVRSYIASFDASKAAVYSASHDELATVFCFFTFHEIRLAPKVKPYPPMLLLVSRQFAQSESVYPTSCMSASPPRVNLRSHVPFKYCTTRIAAFQCE
jgi:hypothetical protein